MGILDNKFLYCITDLCTCIGRCFNELMMYHILLTVPLHYAYNSIEVAACKFPSVECLCCTDRSYIFI